MIVAIRAVEPSDLEFFYQLQADPQQVAGTGVPARARPEFDSHWERITEDPHVTLRAITLDGALVGNILCFQMEGDPEVGYRVANSHWGRGVASAALGLFLEILQRPLTAVVLGTNAASQRVLSKHGFEVVQRRIGTDGLEELHYLLS